MRKYLQILFLLSAGLTIASNNGYAQELSSRKIKKFVKKGRKAYRTEEYWKAKSYYDKVTEANTSKAQYWFEAGLAYYDSQVKREDAIVFFEKALSLSEAETIPEIYYYAAKTYHFRGEFEKAIEYYNTFLKNITNDKKGQDTRAIVIREIEICNNGIDLRDVHLYDVKEIIKLDESVNSEYLEYAPVISVNEDLLLFCSRRPPGKKQHMDGLYYEDIFYARKRAGAIDGPLGDNNWEDSQIIDKSSQFISKEINEGKAHEAPVSISPDGNTLYIYKENSIWKSQKDEEGKWGIPIRMNQNVNIGEANPHVFITPDESEMFIVSTGVEDSFGERDLYYSSKDSEGNWIKPVNMGPKINTQYKEDAPYLSKDGKSLYFASQGHNSMGGFDIFRTIRDENGEWGEPRNIGTPVNSAGDDIYYIENEEGTLAYYASMRPGSYGYLDIYTAKYDCKNIPVTEVKGYAIYSQNHLPVNGVIKVINVDTEEEMGTFDIDGATGKYTMVLPPENTYRMELIVLQPGFEQGTPHREEFFIPKQCEAYNLFQQINIDRQYDDVGRLKGQSATFQQAMFDIDQRVEEEFDIDFEYEEGTNTNTGGITGNLAHSDEWDAKGVEVVLLNEDDQIVRVTKTDDKGDFTFEKLDTAQTYKVMVNEEQAVASYKNWDKAHPSEFYMQGEIRQFDQGKDIEKLANLQKLGFVPNNRGQLVNTKGDFVTIDGEPMNSKGQLIDSSGEIIQDGLTRNEKGQPINEKGQPIDEKGNVIQENTLTTSGKNPDGTPRKETTIFLANIDKILSDMSVTDSDGEFEFLNPTTPFAIIEEINDNTTVTYNIDASDPEILYSAILTTIDPEDENVTYTESMDLVELKQLTETDEQMREFANILFDFDKFFLRQKSEDVLEALFNFMDENPSVQVKLDGHTDWLGTEQYNEALSKKRALSAHKYLVDKGIAPSRIENLWFGENNPFAKNTNADGSDNEANRQLNRRVEIKVEIPELADLYLSL